MRFRRYLGAQYMDENNVIKEKEIVYKNEIVGRPIFPIYILAEKITKAKIPVLKIGRQYIDVATNKVLKETNRFFEALTHDAIFVQIPYLKGQRRTDLEKLLHIFDQSNIEFDNKKILDIDEKLLPKKYNAVIRRLQKAWVTPNMVKYMNAEDDYMKMLRLQHEEIKQRENELKEKAIELEEKSSELKEKLSEIGVKNEYLKNAIRSQLKLGKSLNEISKVFGIPFKELEQFVK